MAGFLSVVYGSLFLFLLSVLKLWLLSRWLLPRLISFVVRRRVSRLSFIGDSKPPRLLPSLARHPRLDSAFAPSPRLPRHRTNHDRCVDRARGAWTSPSAPSASCTSATSWSASTTVPSNASSSGICCTPVSCSPCSRGSSSSWASAPAAYGSATPSTTRPRGRRPPRATTRSTGPGRNHHSRRRRRSLRRRARSSPGPGLSRGRAHPTLASTRDPTRPPKVSDPPSRRRPPVVVHPGRPPMGAPVIS